MKRFLDIQEVVNKLNTILELDPSALNTLLCNRVRINDVLAESNVPFTTLHYQHCDEKEFDVVNLLNALIADSGCELNLNIAEQQFELDIIVENTPPPTAQGEGLTNEEIADAILDGLESFGSERLDDGSTNGEESPAQQEIREATEDWCVNQTRQNEN